MTEATREKTTTEDRLNEMQVALNNMEVAYTEALAELELALEDIGWDGMERSDREFSRGGLEKICKRSFMFFEKNPIIQRAVQVQAAYVFGQGVTIKAEHPLVDEVLQKFIRDKRNQKVFTSIPAMTKCESDLRIDANVFFVFSTNDRGAVRISQIVFSEIWDTITNPEDKGEVWYYERRWTPAGTSVQKIEYYPDINFHPADKARHTSHNGKPVNWDKPMLHVKVNAVLDQKFGVSELYSAQDWARAYNKFLENWATIVRSYARFAWTIVKKTGSAGRLAAKNKIDSRISEGAYKPAPSPGAAFVHDADTKLSPVRTAGATTSAEDGRRLLLMVCAATGLPETFYGDVSVGTLATARSLNRPTELAFSLRQRTWESCIEDIGEFVIRAAADVGYTSETYGDLEGFWEDDGWGGQDFVFGPDRDNEDPELRQQPIPADISVDFPPLVEDDQKAQIDAIISAATLDGKTMAGTLDLPYVAEKLLRVLGETSIEEAMERMFPDGKEQTDEESAVATLPSAVNELQQAVEALAEAQQVDRKEAVKTLATIFVEAFNEARNNTDDSDS